MSSKPIITYFNVGGRAEVFRLLLEIAGIDYDFVALNNPRFPTKNESWTTYKEKNADHLPFGQLPRYQEPGGVDLVQSCTITRYLAKKHGFNGSNDQEALLIDLYFEGVEDLGNSARILFRFPEEHKAQKSKEFTTETLPKLLGHFTRALNKNNGGKSYLVGNKLSYADLGLFSTLKGIKGFLPTSAEAISSSGIDEYYNRISNEPKIKAFFDRDPYKSDS